MYRAAHRDEGQSLPLVALLLWAAAGTALVLAHVGVRAIDQARAQAGADAVALGVARDGAAVAETLAVANGVRIVDLTTTGDADVVVRRGAAVAAARARATPAGRGGLHPDLLMALARADEALGQRITVVSGLRSRAEQQRLWESRGTNPYPVAPPGTSLHELGLAVDIPLDQARRIAAIPEVTGLCQPLPLLDPVHFTLCQTRQTR